MQLTFLGTSAMVPTKERNHSGLLLEYKGEGILFDCGEGTQRQLKKAGLKATKVSKICISHWHGDHVLGIPGLLQTLAASDYDKTIELYGPKGTKQHMTAMFEAFVFDRALKLKVTEVHKGKFFESKDFVLAAYPLRHGITSLGYVFQEKDRLRIDLKKAKKFGIPEGPLMGKLQEGKSITHNGKKIDPDDVTYKVKGKKIGVIADTMLCDACYDIAQDADLLISESSYASKLEAKAKEYKHMTAKQAGLVASQSNVKKLILTHFSTRYKNALELQEDAQQVFDDVVCAEDLMKITV